MIESARNTIATHINCKPGEIVFTSGATEANNLALHGIYNASDKKRKHIIVSTIEHNSVFGPLEELMKQGCDASCVTVDKDGMVDLEALENAINDNTILISVVWVNNEIGTVQDIKAISKIARKHNICFHTDAVQAIGHLDINVKALGMDMMSVSGHKIYSTKGAGFLYVRSGVKIHPYITGGGQENGLRSGTENVHGIVGMGKAVELIPDNRKHDLSALKEKLKQGIQDKIPDIRINGNAKPGGILNVTFTGVDGKQLLKALSANNIYCSASCACHAHSDTPSHVLKSIGLGDEDALSSLRFSMGIYNTEEDIDYILTVLPPLVDYLRNHAR